MGQGWSEPAAHANRTLDPQLPQRLETEDRGCSGFHPSHLEGEWKTARENTSTSFHGNLAIGRNFPRVLETMEEFRWDIESLRQRLESYSIFLRV